MPDDTLVIDAFAEIAGRVINKSHATGHARGEVVADLAQDDSNAAGHVFAAVRATAFDHHFGTGIAHRKALACLAGCKQPTGRRAVEHGIADDRVVVGYEFARRHRANDNGRARQSFADIVVGVAEHFELETLNAKSAERLSG